MGGISRITLLEIFTQPYDLMISVPCTDEGKCAILISRGPGHSFKLLLSTEPTFESREAAIIAVNSTLEGILKIGGKEIMDPTELAGSMLNPNCLPLEQLTVLNRELAN